MNKKVSVLLAVLFILAAVFGSFAPVNTASAKQDYRKGVRCMKQSTIRIEGDRTIYFDPYAIEGEPKDGDIVFITHTHGDHFDVNQIAKVLKKNGTLVITADGVSMAKAAGFKKIITVKPGKSYSVSGIKFTTVAAYNKILGYHPTENAWVGYNVTINKAKYYIAGDTDYTSEMKKVKTDVAFLPVGGTYTMDAVQAAKAANTFKPKVAVPIHFGDVVGTTADAREFISLLDEKIEGAVLKDLLQGISHMKQSTVRIAAGKVIYIDPYNIEGEPRMRILS
jgi:L-ascorbate metabolism protein UlaG (beta-lactamase superfamily)